MMPREMSYPPDSYGWQDYYLEKTTTSPEARFRRGRCIKGHARCELRGLASVPKFSGPVPGVLFPRRVTRGRKTDNAARPGMGAGWLTGKLIEQPPEFRHATSKVIEPSLGMPKVDTDRGTYDDHLAPRLDA